MKQHPTMDTLLEYLEQPEARDFADLRLHIATCGQCRGNIQRLTELKHHIHTYGPMATVNAPTENNLAAQEIEQYVDGQLPDEHAAQIKAQLQSDPGALKAALHYASHSVAMEKTVLNPPAIKETAEQASRPSFFAPGVFKKGFLKQLAGLFDLRPPVWISVPATAAIVFALSIVTVPNWMASSSHDINIAAYQDKAVIHFQETKQLPGIGFFNKAHRSSKSFDAMKVRLSKNSVLEMRWTPVENAKSYQLALHVVNEGQKISVKELSLSDNRATITDFIPKYGKRYEWTLNGETTDAKSFYTTGGFVINNPQ